MIYGVGLPAVTAEPFKSYRQHEQIFYGFIEPWKWKGRFNGDNFR
jgi:hypothetical protein